MTIVTLTIILKDHCCGAVRATCPRTPVHCGVLRQFALLGERGLGVHLVLSALLAVAPPNHHMDTHKTCLLDLLRH